MIIYIYKPKKSPLLTGYVAEELLNYHKRGLKRATITLDLGKTRTWVELSKSGVTLPSGLKIPWSVLEEISGADAVYVASSRGLSKLAWFSSGFYYKLKVVKPYSAPTLEISGIHMHRVKGITPWRDAREKVYRLGIERGDKVLDICTGLGYTAIHELRAYASKVVTIEKSIDVLKIAEYNPWSWELRNRRLTIVLGDATKVLKKLMGNYFDKIIHDPPRSALAGELYSTAFYKELYRVLRKGGRLFHYTGEPRRVRGVKIARGVMNRLRHVGFKPHFVESLMGVLAVK